MEADETRALRREILDDVGALFHEELAAAAWGRLLVEVVRGPGGAPAVAGVDVEEVLDEPRVDAVFGAPGARGVMPVLAKAVEALCAIDDLDLDEVRGGTFVRLEDERFAWLPGLVHAPTQRFDAERDALLVKLRAKNDRFDERFGRPPEEHFGLDLGRESLAWTVASKAPLKARATLVGTFVPASRTWGWGSTNPHAPDGVRRGSAALIDAIEDRDLWELSTPVFATDETTAWALAALVCDRAKGEAVVCAPDEEGLVFVLVRDVVRTDN